MVKIRSKLLLIVIYCVFWKIQLIDAAIITGTGALQMGDSMAAFCTAKILALKYHIPLYYSEFIHSDLFMIGSFEQKLTPEMQKKPKVYVRNEDDLKNNMHKDVLFWTDIRTLVKYVSPEEFTALKIELQLKVIPSVKPLPQGVISIGVHIRKGNGGGAHYDGEVTSIQEFDFDQSKIIYRTDYENFPFDWSYYQRLNGHFIRDNEYSRDGKIASDHVNGGETRFPPNQFYIDQIKKISNTLGNVPLYVVICTDDKDPEQLVDKLKKSIGKPNIIIEYENDRHLPYRERMLRDLYLLSRCDALIRPQSYFSKTAELIGNHKLVIYPLKFEWYGNKLVMTEIVIKGSIKSLTQ